MSQEDEGKFREAEESYLKAARPKEAVLMYINVQDWASASRIAEQFDPELMQEIYIAQAKASYEQHDLGQAESFLLKAQRPEAVIKIYKVFDALTLFVIVVLFMSLYFYQQRINFISKFCMKLKKPSNILLSLLGRKYVARCDESL